MASLAVPLSPLPAVALPSLAVSVGAVALSDPSALPPPPSLVPVAGPVFLVPPASLAVLVSPAGPVPPAPPLIPAPPPILATPVVPVPDVPPTVAPSARASTTGSFPWPATQVGWPGKEVTTSDRPTREAIATPFHWSSPWTATS